MDLSQVPNDSIIENRTFDEIAIGESASIVRTLTQEDIELFAVVSGDVNPAHLDPAYAETDLFHRIIAHGMWGGALISAVLGTELPGPGTIYISQDLHFRHRSASATRSPRGSSLVKAADRQRASSIATAPTRPARR